MGTLIEKSEWTEGIRYFEKDAIITGGPDAKDNEPIQDLTNRTVYLKDKIDAAETAFAGHKEAIDPHPQYVTDQEMADYVGTVIVQGQVNADWNATEGAAAILNKPELAVVATSGDYNDLQNKPLSMTGATAETAGLSGFVPAPATGDQNKVLKGDGTWGTIASRNIGETVFSLLPLSDVGLHLLDGSLLQIGGIYDAFIAHVSGLQTDYPGLFIDENSWQESVSMYGVCGKFVYMPDVSLRLPKITGFVEGTLDACALGDLVEAGLPNITGAFGAGALTKNNDSAVVGLDQLAVGGCFTAESAISITGINETPAGGWFMNGRIGLNATLSNQIYGKSNTVQPQSIKGYLYMVVATSAKTDIQVDIDTIATDLNGKAGVDLANVNQTGKTLIANMAMPSDQYVDLTPPATGRDYTFTAPADGYVCMRVMATAASQNITVSTEQIASANQSSSAGYWMSAMIPVRKNKVFACNWSGGALQYFRFYYAQGSKPA